MKNKEILDLGKGLIEFVQKEPNLNCEQLYYGIKRNISRFEKVRDSLVGKLKYHEDTPVYQNALKECQLRHAKKNEDGTPKFSNGQLELESRISSDLETVRAEFVDVIDFNEKTEKEFEKILEQENKEFEIYKISRKKLKDLKYNYNFSLIYDILED